MICQKLKILVGGGFMTFLELKKLWEEVKNLLYLQKDFSRSALRFLCQPEKFFGEVEQYF